MNSDGDNKDIQGSMHKNSAATAWYEQQCPHCNSAGWVKIHRNFWQKILHSNESRCYCLSCRKKFWKEKA